jgi:hypothetical protein
MKREVDASLFFERLSKNSPLLISLFVFNEFRFDRFHGNSDLAFRVLQKNNIEGFVASYVLAPMFRGEDRTSSVFVQRWFVSVQLFIPKRKETDKNGSQRYVPCIGIVINTTNRNKLLYHEEVPIGGIRGSGDVNSGGPLR